MLAENARPFKPSPRPSPMGSPSLPPTPVDSPLGDSRGVLLSPQAFQTDAQAAAFSATGKSPCPDSSVKGFHHRKPLFNSRTVPRIAELVPNQPTAPAKASPCAIAGGDK